MSTARFFPEMGLRRKARVLSDRFSNLHEGGTGCVRGPLTVSQSQGPVQSARSGVGGRKPDTDSPARFDHDAFGQGCGRFHAATRCMFAEAGSIRSGTSLAAAPGPAATASGRAGFGERQARLGLHQIDKLAYAEVFLQFRVLSITNFPSVIRIK